MAFLVVRGHKINDLINIPYAEKIFYMNSIQKYFEEENQKIKAMGGG